MTTENRKDPAPEQAASLFPGKPGFAPEKKTGVGGVLLRSEPIEYNTGRRTVRVTVRNTGDRPVQVGSHFHLFEVNRYLEFDRDATFGFHLNIPATTAVRFEPGDQKEVEAVVFGGKRRVIGFNALVLRSTGEEDEPSYYPARLRALRRVREAGFKVAEPEAPESGAATPVPAGAPARGAGRKPVEEPADTAERTPVKEPGRNGAAAGTPQNAPRRGEERNDKK